MVCVCVCVCGSNALVSVYIDNIHVGGSLDVTAGMHACNIFYISTILTAGALIEV